MTFDTASSSILSLIEAFLLILERALSVARTLRLLSSKQPAQSYENLFLDLMLDLKDTHGRRAIITRKLQVHFLTEEAGVVTSPIWGEGAQLDRYDLQGAKRLGSRSDGSRRVLLLALDRPALKGSSNVLVV